MSIRRGLKRRKIQATAIISAVPKINPSNGDKKMNATVFAMPDDTSDPVPDLASAAPISPPISACDDDDGIPKIHVMRFHVIAPISAPKIT